ncbi:MAG: acyl carrier protein [Candidatus Omnitrophica bacterium]|nr:acyl carrier protein [Candidatus Omnitrophota bacterium]
MNDQNEKIRKIFADVLGIPVEKIDDDLQYNSIPEWDSIAHMALITALDKSFDIMIETEDIIDMSSFGKAKEILQKYEVVL